ncbi:MATE family efflux transporter [Paenibacillus methanolicus]|uniref:MATE family multidrug resistance protein n=1 Tax=Paenibacillus methanolicus TaxID=582686 RepID=A0A5S5C0F8_9BACL|nr:MATE family efflux transporter [Paenibacillus methanolicus]TYP72098.1 MATE family multidrug resistance protein [Paenibacillus methanolicus]
MKNSTITLPSHRAYLALALPLTLSTITTPLLGAADTAIIGQLNNPAYLGGVAVGTLIFNTLYWLFGFLRVSTSAFAAQAVGAGDKDEGIAAFARPALLALAIGLAFIGLQNPILSAALRLIDPAPDVAAQAALYYEIRIWGAPLTLLNYVLIGWLMGLSRLKATLFVQIAMNVANIALDVLFVRALDWSVAGVAAATLIAEGLACAAGLALVVRSPMWKQWRADRNSRWKAWFRASKWRTILSANRDLMIRTACLLAMFNLFTSRSAGLGTEMLAANAILLQLHYIMAYFFDGFGNAGSIYAGQAHGARSAPLLRRTLRLSWMWTVIVALTLTVIYGLVKRPAIGLFTEHAGIRELATSYSGWLLGFPVSAGIGLVFYGVFTGMTETRPIRDSMLLSLALFLLAAFVLVPAYENNGLWIAFLVFAFARSVFLALYVPRLVRKLASG